MKKIPTIFKTERALERRYSIDLEGLYKIKKNEINYQTSLKLDRVSKFYSTHISDCLSYSNERNQELETSYSKEFFKSSDYLDRRKEKQEHLSDLMNSSQNRLKNYSGLMDLINNSLSDIKNILNVETEKNEFKAKPERESEDKLIENLQINYRNPLNKRSHKTVKSCNENELEKIRFELGIPDVSRGRINSRNIDKIKVIDKLYMTTIDENEEKNNESHDHSDSSMIHENVIILQPKGGKLFKNLFNKKIERSYKFTPKNNNDKVSQFKNYITDCTEKTTVENDFLDRNISKDSNINIVLDTDQGYIIKK